MNIVEGILVVIVILVIVLINNPQLCSPKSAISTVSAASLPAATTTIGTTVAQEHFHHSPQDQYEGMAGQASYIGTQPYSELILNQGVDPQVVRNHIEFAEDRIKNSSRNITGRTMALGEVEGTDQITWWGIRGRPQHVPVGNPTQVPDVDPKAFSNAPKFIWNTN